MKFHGEQIGDRFTARLERGPLASAELNSDSFGGLLADMHHAYNRIMAHDQPQVPDAAPNDPSTVEPSGSTPNNNERGPDGPIDDGKFQFAMTGETGPVPDGQDTMTNGRFEGEGEDTRSADAAKEQIAADAAGRQADSDDDDAKLPALKDNKPTPDETRAAESELRAKADAAGATDSAANQSHRRRR